MAIKTQLVEGQRRIITKVVNGQRRASCSCCEGEPSCCMYPADELGNLYGADDLPDAVTVNWTDRFVGSMSKSGSGYAGGGATLQVVNGIWRLSDSNGTRNVGRCLIRGDGNLTAGDDLVEDQFEDTYTMSLSTLNSSVTLYRKSLCLWEDIIYDDDDDTAFVSARLQFTILPEDLGPPEFVGEDLMGWWLSHDVAEANTDFWSANLAQPRTGNQNTPVGSYTWTSYSFNGVSITVTIS
jgi:hypothetical protein